MKTANFGLLYVRRLPQIKWITFSKNPMKGCWLKEKFCYFRNYQLYISLFKKLNKLFFFLLVKLYAVHAVSLKSTKNSTSFRMKMNFQKMHHTPYEVVSCWLGCFKWNFGSILLEQISYQGKDNIQWNDGCKAAFRIGCTKSTN